MAENKTNTPPTSTATAEGSTTPPTAAADSKPPKTWKSYILPALAGGTVAYFIGVPVLGGLAVGAGAKYAWRRWKNRAASVG